ncbi:sialoadhesin [Anarrhichthys ocellatus]|uniref:sialoadhesin n=1 Tax=Anarrhichthys ocellatus TaxID=433405 RepID=UPI0012EE9227|nr:high affinity immunoglobulin gamma Fc receptor I [Anarrhichthys ocellatus]
MGLTLFCALSLSLLNTLLYCGHAEVSNRIVVTQQHNWSQIFIGETVTVVCEIEGGGNAEWEYEWRTTSSNTPPTHREYRISSASVSQTGSYWCKGRRDSYSSTEWSNAFSLIVSSHKPSPTVMAYSRTIPVGGKKTLTCFVDESADWMYYWFRRTSVFSDSQIIRDGGSDRVISISEGGIYHCRGGRGNPVFFTEDSDPVTIEKRVSNKAVVSLQPNWPLIFSGETITVRCDIYGGGNSGWEYEWSRPNSDTIPTHDECRIGSAAVNDSGNYRCMGEQSWDSYSSTEWSEVITLTVSSHRPKANLSADNRGFPVGGSVTLTCSVGSSSSSSSGWTYYWYRGETSSQPLTTPDVTVLSTGQISVSQEGLYWCVGQRGNPVYYTEYSDSINIHKIVTNAAAVTRQPNWPEIYSGETIALRCEMQGGDAEWEYEWMTTSSYKPPNQNKYRISVSPSYNGDYWCMGRLKRAQRNSTGWSISFKLTVSYKKPQPVLTVSPLWLSPGDSVTLTCSVEHPSAGWRFFWYKAVPKPADDSYISELLPGSTDGTEQDSYIVHGQTHTAGYVCRAGRGDPVFYTQYSETKFVWSGDVHSAASLTVSPDRVQHLTSDSVSLSCEGNSTKWRVMRFFGDGRLAHCFSWGTMIGSTCHLNHYSLWVLNAVHWCESGSGEFSNAVNITRNYFIILVSPVHPVREGGSVTFGCMRRTGKPLSNVTFYKNDKLVPNSDRGELEISAVSKSDEGFYRCEHSGVLSQQSWMSVKSSSSPSPVLLIAGLVSGIVLMVLLSLVLLCWYKKSKDTCCHRLIQSQRTNQSSAVVHTVNQDENQQQLYSSLLHGDVCVYETIVGSGITGRGTV